MAGELNEWMRDACAALDLDLAGVNRTLVLDLARDVAHGVARPAAPLTAYLLGLAVGRGADPEQAAATLARLAAGYAPTEPPEQLPTGKSTVETRGG
jgi:hypothetical protein